MKYFVSTPETLGNWAESRTFCQH